MLIPNDATCTIEATVVSGFETVAAAEIEEKLGVKPRPLYDDYETFKGTKVFFLFFSPLFGCVPSAFPLRSLCVLSPSFSLWFLVSLLASFPYLCLLLVLVSLPGLVRSLNLVSL